MRKGGGNRDVDELAYETPVSREIDHVVVGGAPAEVGAAFPGFALHQHALARADHAAGERLRLLVDFGLQPLQPGELDFVWRVIGQLGRGCSGPAAVEETEARIEA